MEDLIIHKVKNQLMHLINIQNILISVKDHQKKEFALDKTVSNFLQYYKSKKNSPTKHTPLDIISAVNNENLIRETIENRKKSKRK